MRISDVKDEVYIPDPLVKASQQAHEVKVRSEMQKPTFMEILYHNIAALKGTENPKK